MCNTDEVENEYHFMFVCPLYNGLRCTLIESLNLNVDQFNLLTLSEKFRMCFEHPKEMGNYITDAMNLRRTILWN